MHFLLIFAGLFFMCVGLVCMYVGLLCVCARIAASSSISKVKILKSQLATQFTAWIRCRADLRIFQKPLPKPTPATASPHKVAARSSARPSTGMFTSSCRVLPCVAVCCRVLPCVTVCCSVLQCVACVAVCCSVLPCVELCCSVCCSQCVAVCCSVLQCVAVY